MIEEPLSADVLSAFQFANYILKHSFVNNGKCFLDWDAHRDIEKRDNQIRAKDKATIAKLRSTMQMLVKDSSVDDTNYFAWNLAKQTLAETGDA